MEALRGVAPRLNGATNQAAAATKAADDFLAELSLGVPGPSGPFEERSAAVPGDAETAKDVAFSYLAYGRLGVSGRCSIHVTERTERPVADGWGNIECWETIGEDSFAWSSCPRDRKLKAFAKLPNLLGNIADEAELLTAKAEETGALVETMFGVPISERAKHRAEVEVEPKEVSDCPVYWQPDSWLITEVETESKNEAVGPLHRTRHSKKGR